MVRQTKRHDPISCKAIRLFVPSIFVLAVEGKGDLDRARVDQVEEQHVGLSISPIQHTGSRIEGNVLNNDLTY